MQGVDFNLDCGLRDYVIMSFTLVGGCGPAQKHLKDQLHVPNGPMTRSKTNALKATLNALVWKVSTKSDLKDPLGYQEEALIHLIHVQEGPNPILFRPWDEDNKRKQKNLTTFSFCF